MKYLLIAGLFFSLNTLADLPPPSGGGDGFDDTSEYVVCTYKDNDHEALVQLHPAGGTCVPTFILKHNQQIRHFDASTGLPIGHVHGPECTIILEKEIRKPTVG